MIWKFSRCKKNGANEIIDLFSKQLHLNNERRAFARLKKTNELILNLQDYLHHLQT